MSIDIVDDLEAEGSPLSRRAARYIRIKRETDERTRVEYKRDLARLYECREQTQAAKSK
jgi:hypothetical protein